MSLVPATVRWWGNDRSVANGREELRCEIAGALGSLTPGRFAIVDYAPGSGGDAPFAQAALEPTGWYLEVVSDHYLPREDWPIDEMVLRRTGWVLPPEGADNWYRYEDSQTEVERLALPLLDALVEGRRCDRGGEFRVTTGRFPAGPDGGEPRPIPQALAAA